MSELLHHCQILPAGIWHDSRVGSVGAVGGSPTLELSISRPLLGVKPEAVPSLFHATAQAVLDTLRSLTPSGTPLT